MKSSQTHDGRSGHFSLQFEVEALPKKVVRSAVGLNVGLTSLTTPSTGESIPTLRGEAGGEGPAAQATARGALPAGVRRQAKGA